MRSHRVRAPAVPGARGAPRAAAAGGRVRAGLVLARRAAAAAALRAPAGPARAGYCLGLMPDLHDIFVDLQ